MNSTKLNWTKIEKHEKLTRDELLLVDLATIPPDERDEYCRLHLESDEMFQEIMKMSKAKIRRLMKYIELCQEFEIDFDEKLTDGETTLMNYCHERGALFVDMDNFYDSMYRLAAETVCNCS